MDENNNVNSNNSSKRFSIGSILGWTFGVIFALSGVATIFSEPVAGILMLLLSAILLPPIYQALIKKFNVSISGGLKAVIIIGVLVAIGASIPTEDTVITEKVSESDSSTIETNPQQDQIESNESDTSTSSQNDQLSTESESQPPPQTNEATFSTNDTEVESSNTVEDSTETVSQRNAVRKAQSYLNYSAFSRTGLIEQLEFDQFSNADAIYGVDNSGADWFEQAAKKAGSYMEYSAFSRAGLIEQLKFDGFNQAQAEYGADQVGF